MAAGAKIYSQMHFYVDIGPVSSFFFFFFNSFSQKKKKKRQQKKGEVQNALMTKQLWRIRKRTRDLKGL